MEFSEESTYYTPSLWKIDLYNYWVFNTTKRALRVRIDGNFTWRCGGRPEDYIFEVGKITQTKLFKSKHCFQNIIKINRTGTSIMGEYEWNEPAGPKCVRASPAALGLHSAGRGALGHLRHRSATLVSIRPPGWWGGVSGEGREPPDSTAIIASTVFTDAPKPKAPPLRRPDPGNKTNQTSVKEIGI